MRKTVDAEFQRIAQRKAEPFVATIRKDTNMLISRETANLILDDAGILGRDREWILQNHDVIHFGYLVAAILRQGDGSLSTFMK